ncbi:uncharacterized protein LOC123545031 [Mercenaria mercenaria]|uniref:uncharacterized protein LOC123545031 n=1 Tax=Mercenaria mercenaria TaxID=6596 RepID=UPI00234F96FB|nr:uncharacterized protein LOC123545031 [Mercenaria mercenaria]
MPDAAFNASSLPPHTSSLHPHYLLIASLYFLIASSLPPYTSSLISPRYDFSPKWDTRTLEEKLLDVNKAGIHDSKNYIYPLWKTLLNKWFSYKNSKVYIVTPFLDEQRMQDVCRIILHNEADEQLTNFYVREKCNNGKSISELQETVLGKIELDDIHQKRLKNIFEKITDPGKWFHAKFMCCVQDITADLFITSANFQGSHFDHNNLETVQYVTMTKQIFEERFLEPLTTHYETHFKFQCIDCEKNYMKLGILKTHTENKHKKTLETYKRKQIKKEVLPCKTTKKIPRCNLIPGQKERLKQQSNKKTEITTDGNEMINPSPLSRPTTPTNTGDEILYATRFEDDQESGPSIVKSESTEILCLDENNETVIIMTQQMSEAADRPLWPEQGMECPVPHCSAGTFFKRYDRFSEHWARVHLPVVNIFKCLKCSTVVYCWNEARQHTKRNGSQHLCEVSRIANPEYICPAGVSKPRFPSQQERKENEREKQRRKEEASQARRNFQRVELYGLNSMSPVELDYYYDISQW